MNKNNKSTIFSIPQFALYGEQAHKQDPEFVHIESIAERSSKNGWLIKPHRHTHLFQILYMTEGELELKLDESSSSHKGSWAIAIPAGTVHAFKFHPKTKGIVLSLSTNLLSFDKELGTEAIFEEIMSQTNIVEIEESSDLHQQMTQYLNLVKHELILSSHNQQLTLSSLVKLILITLRRQIQIGKLNIQEHKTEIQLTSKFKILVEEHYKEHWNISTYARSLHISVSTLNRLCNETLGTTAKTFIQERLLIEAKRRLIYTRQALDQIAYTLGYKDPAYFSRVFKQQQGVPPKEFRESLK